jgi:hypothetical protein
MPGAPARAGLTPGASSDGLEQSHTLLCRREAAYFQRAAKDTTASGDELLVACTQESRLFLELNEETEGAAGVQERPIHFVNIRETAGWSAEGAAGHAQDRRAAGSGAIARAGPGGHRQLPQRRALPGHRPADAAERAAALLATSWT